MTNTSLQSVFCRWHQLRAKYGAKLLARLIQAGWLTPVVRSHRFSLYCLDEVRAADRRLHAGEMPPPLRRDPLHTEHSVHAPAQLRR